MIETVNTLIQIVSKLMNFLLGILPNSFLQSLDLPVIDSFFLENLNAFLPVAEILYFLEVYASVYIVYKSTALLGRSIHFYDK